VLGPLAHIEYSLQVPSRPLPALYQTSAIVGGTTAIQLKKRAVPHSSDRIFTTGSNEEQADGVVNTVEFRSGISALGETENTYSD
jgi:hypothetical protein